MFYVKTQLARWNEIETEITDKNVFCRCPHCGREVQVNLSWFAGDEDFDINSTSVLCIPCSAAYAVREK